MFGFQYPIIEGYVANYLKFSDMAIVNCLIVSYYVAAYICVTC